MAAEEEVVREEEEELNNLTKEVATKSTTEVITVLYPRTLEVNNSKDLNLIIM